MYTIRPVPKRYAWGSNEQLQHMFQLHGVDAQGPIAEMWFSGHAQSPSVIDIQGHSEVPLTEAIRSNPDGMIGMRGSREFGPVLPFLFKIIAADVPLSLQVHPVDFQARAGFNIENYRGVPLDAPERSFKDMNEKSEMVVALEPFLAAVGFAPRTFALRNLQLLQSPIAKRMVQAFGTVTFRGNEAAQEFAQADEHMPIAANTWSESRKRIFRAFYTAITAPSVDAEVLIHDLEQAQAQCEHPKNRMAFDFALRAAHAFPGDASVLALLMMNPVQLEEGESVFLPAGIPHAYIHGMGAEIMTNSDNVLRAGMTVKHKDIDHVLQCVDCRSTTPVDPSDSRLGALLMRDIVFYRPGVSEYMLAYGHVDAAHETWPIVNQLAVRYDALVQQMSGHVTLPHLGPRVVVCTQGSVRCVTERDERVLHQGDAVFVPAEDGWMRVEPVVDGEGERQGSYVMASTPF